MIAMNGGGAPFANLSCGLSILICSYKPIGLHFRT